MDNLKPCPFCGKIPVIEDCVISSCANRTGNIPDGSILVKTKPTTFGKTLYYYERHGYKIHCLTSKCICRNNAEKFKTGQEATDAWNIRNSD